MEEFDLIWKAATFVVAIAGFVLGVVFILIGFKLLRVPDSLYNETRRAGQLCIRSFKGTLNQDEALELQSYRQEGLVQKQLAFKVRKDGKYEVYAPCVPTNYSTERLLYNR